MTGQTYEEALKERDSYMDRLIEAGYDVTGGGYDLKANVWDIFLIDPDDPEGEITISGPEQAEAFLDGKVN